MKLNQELINEIRSEASVAEVIGHFLPLSKKGRNFVAVCPFHDDHDPSLSISEERKMFKCFVCGKGGSVFTFVQEYKHVSFPEAVAQVAEIIGKPIQWDVAKSNRVLPHQRLYDVVKESASFLHYLLMTKGGQPAKDYLLKRGLNEEILTQFEIGYNPSGALLSHYLQQKNYRDEEIIEANLARLGHSGMYDVFADRVVFPIQDATGNYVGFTARDISGAAEAKYINTAETKIYTKGDIVYNAFRARSAIKDAGRVIVCEGVLDVIAFARAGLPFAVATLGTACSSKQLAILRSLSAHLLLAYDGDEAGQKAILRLGKQALKQGFVVTVLANETGLDPDEIVLTYEGKGLRDLVSKALPFMEFVFSYYKKHLQLENYSDRKKMMLEVGNIIDSLRDEYDRANYEEELAQLTKIRRQTQNQVVGLKKGYNKDASSLLSKVGIDGLSLAEYTILNMMAVSSVAVEIYKQELGSLISEDCEELSLLIIDDYRQHGKCELGRILDQQQNNERLQNLILELTKQDTLSDTYREDLFRGAIQKVKDELLTRNIRFLYQQLEKYATISPTKAQEIMHKITQLTKEKNRRIYGKEEKHENGKD